MRTSGTAREQVAGKVVFRSAKERPFAERKATARISRAGVNDLVAGGGVRFMTSSFSNLMMRMRRRWRRLGIAAVLLALGWALFAQLDGLEGPGRATAGPAGDRPRPVGAALERLTALAARPGAGRCGRLLAGDLRGDWAAAPRPPCEHSAGCPRAIAFDPVGAYHEAKANLSQGKLHAAERRLEQGHGPRRSRPGPSP